MSQGSKASEKAANIEGLAVAKKRFMKKRPRRSIKLDKVNPSDFMNYNMTFACEHCSHYDASNRVCTMGYNPQHTLERQLHLYNLTGAMAFCRFLEID